MKKLYLKWMAQHLILQNNISLKFLQKLIILQGVHTKFVLNSKRIYNMYLYYSFMSDCHMVIDASIKVTFHQKDVTPVVNQEELLYPDRHAITLPLNSLNILFNNCETSFNHTTKLEADRYGNFILFRVAKIQNILL